MKISLSMLGMRSSRRKKKKNEKGVGKERREEKERKEKIIHVIPTRIHVDDTLAIPYQHGVKLAQNRQFQCHVSTT